MVPVIENDSKYSDYVWDDSTTQRQVTVRRITTVHSTVTVTLWVENSCGKDTAVTTIAFLPQPNGQLPADTTLCEQVGFFLTHPGSPEVFYKWNDGTDQPFLYVNSAGLYTLFSESPCGSKTDSITVAFSSPLDQGSPRDTAVCADSAVYMEISAPKRAEEAYYLWSTGELTPTITISDTGQYIVTVSWPGCEKVIAYDVQNNGCYERCRPFIPNVFSPNADGINDQLLVKMKCDAENYHFTVTDRWGVQVFATQMPGEGWDGLVEKGPANEGVYFYILTYRDESGESRLFQGSASLVK